MLSQAFLRKYLTTVAISLELFTMKSTSMHTNNVNIKNKANITKKPFFTIVEKLHFKIIKVAKSVLNALKLYFQKKKYFKKLGL